MHVLLASFLFFGMIFSASGNDLRAAEAFTMFSVFNGLQMAIGTLPYGIRMLTETHVVLRRIQVSSVGRGLRPFVW